MVVCQQGTAVLHVLSGHAKHIGWFGVRSALLRSVQTVHLGQLALLAIGLHAKPQN